MNRPPHELDDVDDTAEDPGPSKSRRKRDALAVRSLGERLGELSTAQRTRLGLPDDVIDALALLDRTTARGARKRQLGYIAKRLRRHDTEPFEVALDAMRQGARAALRDHHRAETWRDRLVDSPNPDTLLDALLAEYPSLDRQRARQWIRASRDAGTTGAAPRARRELYRTLRDADAAGSEDDPSRLDDADP